MSDATDVLDRLDGVVRNHEENTRAIEPYSSSEIESLAERLREFDRILETYEDRATGSGDFGGYVAFRSTIDSFVENLPEDLPHREAFEAMGERVDKRRLSERDFDAAREAIEPARDRVRALDARRDAAREVGEARAAVENHIATIDKRIKEVDRLLDLADLDLDAPVDELRDPIEAYDDAVATAFDTWVRDVPAARVLELYSRAESFPLLDVPSPPTELQSYVAGNVPALTIHDLLEYADFSSSKLGHFVDNPQRFRAAVATERTFLQDIGAHHFQIEWPPPPADRLQWRLRELRAEVTRFGDEATLEALRQIESLTRDPERFEELREIAVARESLDAEDRRRIRSGELEDDRRTLIETREELRSALEEAPEPPRA